MTVTVRPMTSADVPVCADIADDAFHKDGLFNALYPKLEQYPGEFRQYWLIRTKQRFWDPLTICVVAERANEETGKPEVVGFAVWWRNGDDERVKEMLRKDTLYDKLERKLLEFDLRYYNLLAHTDPNITKIMRDARFEFITEIRKRPHWYLANFAVMSKHWRRGIGTAMLNAGQIMAKEDNLPIALLASAMGKHLYTKMGFEAVEQLTIPGAGDTVVMYWEPPNAGP